MKKQAVNPYLPNYEYIPDGEPYVFGDRVYVYGSHDRFNGKAYCENNYVCWSAPVTDLGEWKYEGVIYDKKKDPLCDSDERCLFAPDIALKNGRYYLYYAFDFLGVISVAVSDNPVGPFEFYGHVHYSDGTRLGSRQGDAFQFDPGLLVDDDGRVYLYTGFCPDDGLWKAFSAKVPYVNGAMVTELEDDMLTVKAGSEFILPCDRNSKNTGFENHEFFEAASMRKVGEKYYFIYSSVNGHELCYAVSDKPDGGFAYGGTIVSNGDIFLNGRSAEEALNYTGNNHGSIIEISGSWYVFYHRQTNRHQFSRQGCAEKITILPDGTILQAEMTSCGLNGAPLTANGVYDAAIACILMSRNGAKRYEFGDPIEEWHPYFTQDGEDREDNPGQYIANFSDGALAGYKYFQFDGEDRITVTYRGNAFGTLRVSLDDKKNTVSEIEIRPSEDWTTATAKMKEAQGTHALYISYEGEGAADLIKFEMRHS